jgi:hypothetical protein
MGCVPCTFNIIELLPIKKKKLFVQAVVWFLARWSLTYLMHPKEIREGNCDSGHGQAHQLQSREVLLSFFGEHNQGKIVLDIVVRVSITTLMSYPGEKDLQV